MPATPVSFFRRLFAYRYFFVACLVLALLVAFAIGREYMREREIRNDIASLRAQADALATRQFQLVELGNTLQTQSAIEREARLKLGLKKPGETVVVVHDAPAGKPMDPTLDAASAPPEGAIANPTRWWYYFFDHSQFLSLK